MPLKPTLPIKSLAPLVKSALFENSENSLFACDVSISIAQSIPSVPSTATGTPDETSCAKESLKECAGSVETINVGCCPSRKLHRQGGGQRRLPDASFPSDEVIFPRSNRRHFLENIRTTICSRSSISDTTTPSSLIIPTKNEYSSSW